MSPEVQMTEFVQLKRELDKKIKRIRELTSELRSQRFGLWSEQRTVHALVDGQGAIVRIHIANGALRTPHPDQLGPQIAATVSRARAAAADAQRRRFHEMLPALFPSDQDE